MNVLEIYQLIPIRIRISVGLVGLMTGSLLVASAAGFFPNEQKEILLGRAKMCETLAISGTAMVSSGQLESFQVVLDSVLHRDKNVRSIGLISEEGVLIASAGPHQDVWVANGDNGMTQMRVPVFRYGHLWGELQVTFVDTGGVMGLNYWAPAWLLIVLVPACLVQFSFFLRKTLESLDASGAVPTHVENALDTFTVGLVLLNSRDRILFANHRLTDLLGLEPKALLGKRSSDMAWIHPDGDDELPWDIVKSTGHSVNDRILQFDVDGRRLTFSINCTPITGQGYLATFDDITLIEENKVALAEARDAAQSANEAKSQFLANMSHEIRTPLNAVLGFTDVLRRGLVTDSSEAVDHLNMIHRSGSHLMELINDILDLSKIEAGKLQAESVDTHVDEVVTDVAAVLGVRARENDLALEIDFKTPIPRTIQNDPTRLRQVITNLVGNAIKFTEHGSVRIVTELTYSEGSGPTTLRISVLDSGIGMTPEQQSKIFESFVQADSTTTRRFGGTGLGLSISRRLTEAMGGTLTVSSEAGVGSTFRIELPVTPSSLEDLITPEEIANRMSQSASRGNASGIIHLPKVEILVVDDGEANRRLIDLILKRAGAIVSTAENGLEAIKQMGEKDYALVLMDMQMPVMDGYEATRRIRQSGLKTTIIALTGNAMKGDREKCFAAGCNDFLTKPVNLDKLLSVVAGYVGTADSSDDTSLATTVPMPRLGLDASNGFVVSESTNPSSNDSTQSIHPTLPMDDPEFRSITSDFLERLDDRLTLIEEAIELANFDFVQSEAHWLKGAGGTVGLPVLTMPAAKLESAAKEHSVEIAKNILGDIRCLRQRIVIPSSGEHSGNESSQHDMTERPISHSNHEIETVESPIYSTLPLDDDEFCMIIVDFVDRLDSRLVEMRNMLNRNEFVKLAGEAHWLKGAGGTVGYSDFTEPANSLVIAARRSQIELSDRYLSELEAIRCRLVVPKLHANGTRVAD